MVRGMSPVPASTVPASSVCETGSHQWLFPAIAKHDMQSHGDKIQPGSPAEGKQKEDAPIRHDRLCPQLEPAPIYETQATRVHVAPVVVSLWVELPVPLSGCRRYCKRLSSGKACISPVPGSSWYCFC